MSLKALIVDDEPPARRDLMRLLQRESDVTVVGDVSDLDAARAVLAAAAPDVVFLDLRLADTTGFELLPALPAGTAVVIVTAYDHYAVKAFETNALDYVLKPVEPQRLALALARVRAGHAIRPAAAADHAEGRIALPDRLADKDWLLLRDGGREEFVRASAIACITAEGDYTRVGTVDGRTRLVHRTLREWEMRLPGGTFVRVHRSAVVNLRHITAVARHLTSASRLELRGQPPLAISRRAAIRLRRNHG
jgi:two-component system, LytTR family, response regulator